MPYFYSIFSWCVLAKGEREDRFLMNLGLVGGAALPTIYNRKYQPTSQLLHKKSQCQDEISCTLPSKNPALFRQTQVNFCVGLIKPESPGMFRPVNNSSYRDFLLH